MRYIIYYFQDQYPYREKVPTRNLPLEGLFYFLDYKENECWIKFKEDENDPRRVVIWSDDNIKRGLIFSDFNTLEENLVYIDRYHKYSRKRFAEMPAIRIFRDNYEYLEEQWQGIYKRKPNYVIFREHDNGFVDILEKDELSDEDIANMNREHKIYLNYIKRWKEYVKAHPEKRTRVWRCPADNEFESDFRLYDPADEQGVD
ncbi:MAG: hypothetical protein NTU89_04530 [Candidatus Dependentiae bacterium]|nr:hypothetical protein [Candidatus Dependentiae bacterium]